jgi:hypothetical protein
MIRSTSPIAQHPTNFFEVPRLHFDLQLGLMRPPVCTGLFNGRFQTTGIIDMVILQQDHIEEAKAMVDPAADPDSLFFQEPEIGGGLSGVQDPSLIPLQPVDVLPG